MYAAHHINSKYHNMLIHIFETHQFILAHTYTQMESGLILSTIIAITLQIIIILFVFRLEHQSPCGILYDNNMSCMTQSIVIRPVSNLGTIEQLL